MTGLLPRNHLTEESAIQVDLSHETVRLPLYPGTAPVPGEPSKTEKVWFVLLDAKGRAYLTDFGLTKHVESSSGITGSGHFVGTRTVSITW